jgi:hypothetical protein
MMLDPQDRPDWTDEELARREDVVDGLVSEVLEGLRDSHWLRWGEYDAKIAEQLRLKMRFVCTGDEGLLDFGAHARVLFASEAREFVESAYGELLDDMDFSDLWDAADCARNDRRLDIREAAP